jgi:hypothetical protein
MGQVWIGNPLLHRETLGAEPVRVGCRLLPMAWEGGQVHPVGLVVGGSCLAASQGPGEAGLKIVLCSMSLGGARHCVSRLFLQSSAAVWVQGLDRWHTSQQQMLQMW